MPKMVLINAQPALKAGTILDTDKGDSLAPYVNDGAIFIEHKPAYDATLNRVGELYKKGDAVSAQTLMLCIWSLAPASGGGAPSTLTYKPGATSDDYTVGTWAEVKERFAEAPFDRLLVDPTGGTPTVLTSDGVTDFQGRVSIEGANPNADNIPTNTLVIQAGAQIKNPRALRNILVSPRSNATPALAFDLSAENRLMLDNVSIVVHSSSTGPAIKTTAANTLLIDMRASRLAGLGAGRPVVGFAGNVLSCQIYCRLNSVISQTAILRDTVDNTSTCEVYCEGAISPVNLTAAIDGATFLPLGRGDDGSPLAEPAFAFLGQRVFDTDRNQYRYWDGTAWQIIGLGPDTVLWQPGQPAAYYQETPWVFETWDALMTQYGRSPFSTVLVDDSNAECHATSTGIFEQKVSFKGSRPLRAATMFIDEGATLYDVRAFENIDVYCKATGGVPSIGFLASSAQVLYMFGANLILDAGVAVNDTPGCQLTSGISSTMTFVLDYYSGFYGLPGFGLPMVKVGQGVSCTLFVMRGSTIDTAAVDAAGTVTNPTAINFYVDESCAVPQTTTAPATRVFYFSQGVKPVSAAPTKAGQGHIVYDQAAARFRGYNGSAWIDFAPGGSVLTFGCADVGTTNDTRYAFPGYNDTSAQTTSEYVITVPRAGTIRNLYYRALTAGSGGQNLIVTVRKNGVDQTLTLTALNTATSGNNTANSFTVAAGDRVSIKLTKSGAFTTSPSKMMFSVELVLAQTGLSK